MTGFGMVENEEAFAFLTGETLGHAIPRSSHIQAQGHTLAPAHGNSEPGSPDTTGADPFQPGLKVFLAERYPFGSPRRTPPHYTLDLLCSLVPIDFTTALFGRYFCAEVC